MKKVAIQTLGCRTNQLESSIIADKFNICGWQVVKFSDIADIYIINTCAVTGKSDASSRYFARKAKKTNPDAKIILAGCYPQTAPEETAKIDGVDLILGNIEKLDIPELLSREDIWGGVYVSDIMREEQFRDKTVTSASGRVRANIKIQDGCSHRCSYCIIPYARGKSRSSKLSDIINQIRGIIDKGFNEIVLTGIHLGQWGLDFNPKNSLINLLKELEAIKELKRYRLSSLDPSEITDELIELLANSDKFCRHLHISLQSGNAEVLKAMRRRYTVEEYSELINKLVEKIPFINIGSDIIAGFPGETDEHFEDTYKNLKTLPIGYIHVFTYSKRKGVPAASMPEQVDEKIKKQRNAKLTELTAEKNMEFRKKLVGQEFEIIVENSRCRKTGLLKGMTDNFIPVLVEGSDKLKNQPVKIKITSVVKEGAFGILAI